MELASAVLRIAFFDLSHRYKGGGFDYMELNFQNRASAIQFFKAGRFKIWADVAGMDHDVLMVAYREKKELKLFQDRGSKEWKSYRGPAKPCQTIAG